MKGELAFAFFGEHGRKGRRRSVGYGKDMNIDEAGYEIKFGFGIRCIHACVHRFGNGSFWESSIWNWEWLFGTGIVKGVRKVIPRFFGNFRHETKAKR